MTPMMLLSVPGSTNPDISWRLRHDVALTGKKLEKLPAKEVRSVDPSGKIPSMEDVSTEGFVRVGGVAGPVISKSALKLHTYAILVSIEVGDAGHICDEYLNAISVETSVAALELTLAGLWTREPGGYRVSEGETLRVAREVQRQLIALEELRSGR